MCGHGSIGVFRTLAELGRLAAGAVTLDTPVGPVGAEWTEDGSVTIRNVPAFCHAQDVVVDVPDLGRVIGDVAWGGNWFFLTELPGEPLELRNKERLTRATLLIKDSLGSAGVRGADGAEVDHVELFGPAARPDADSRNFVMCPSGAYDRSPCGTGTSARLAALHARGQLPLGRPWRQESISGGLFTAWLSEQGGRLIPYIRGKAFITARATLVFDPLDPFCAGLGA
jgi:proline racemase